MTTYLVWVLVVIHCTGSSCSTAVTIDNIADRNECERVRQLVKDLQPWPSASRCIEVRKVTRKEQS